MTATAPDAIVIAGIGQTTVGKLPELNSVQIQALAVLDAVQDCGLTIRDVDGLINLDPYVEPNSMFGSTVAEYLGIRTSYLSTVDVGGTVTVMTMLEQAVVALERGHCTVVACVFGENMLTGHSAASHGLQLQNLVGGEEWEAPFGSQGMVIPYALVAQRYLDEYGATTRDLAAVAVNTRYHASLNPDARLRTPITLEDHEASRMIASPLRMLDCSLVSDGGGAVVLTTRDRLGGDRHRDRHARVRGMGMRSTHNGAAQLPDIADFGMQAAGRHAYERAGVGPGELDFAQLHDAFTISVLVTLEALGFCAPGEAGRACAEGTTRLGGALPVNTHGGLLSQGHVGGMLHVVEAVRQLRGEAGDRQVPGARLGLVSGNGGVFSVCGAMVLEACS
jgi:acetyl-CoA acetyltransferase